MVAIIPARQSQFFGPVPAVSQNIEFAGPGQVNMLEDLFRQGDFRLEASASLGPFGMIEAGRQRHESLFIQERRQDPLVAKDIGQVLGMILIPTASGNFLPGFFDNRIVQEQKDNRAGLNLKGMEEFLKRQGQDLIHSPGILSQEPGEAGEGSGKERASEGLDPGGSVSFFSQLDEAKNERRKEFERGA